MGTVTYSHTPWFLSYFSSHLQHCLFDVLFPNWPVHFMKVGLMSAFLRALPPTPSTGPGTPKGICWLDEAKQDWVSQLPPPLNILYKPMVFNKIQRHSSIPLEGKLQYDFSISSFFFYLIPFYISVGHTGGQIKWEVNFPLVSSPTPSIYSRFSTDKNVFSKNFVGDDDGNFQGK